MEQLEQPRLHAARFWRNPSVRRLAWILAVALTAGGIGVFVLLQVSVDALERDWLEQQTAIIGQLSADDPEKARQWAEMLANPDSVSAEQAEEGRRLAAEHGLTEALGNRLSPVIVRHEARTWTLLGVGFFALFASLGLLLAREYRRQLTDIRKLAISLEDTVKHNRPMSFRLYGEGELGLLANSVQELAIRLQETIGQLHRDKDFLKDTVADISHQLKTPLASLIIYVDLMLEEKADPASAREFLETCRRELDRMEWLTLTLLKLARLEADALPLQIRPASLGETVSRACDSVRRLAEERSVSIVLELPASEEGELSVPHDSRWLAEAISNLLKNAIEHSPPGSKVTAGWSVTPVFLRLFVQDEGKGIEEKHLPHVFRKFYRASSGGSGVGLGLPLAKTIVERHGGMLSVTNSERGGAVFTLTLPLFPLPKTESVPLTKL